MQKESVDSTMKKNPFIKSHFPDLKEVNNNIPKEEIMYLPANSQK